METVFLSDFTWLQVLKFALGTVLWIVVMAAIVLYVAYEDKDDGNL